MSESFLGSLKESAPEQANGEAESGTNANENSAPEITSSETSADWRSHLGDDYRQHSALSSFKDADGLAKSYINLVTKLGKNPIVRPAEGAGEEEWGRFYQELGRPESHDKYIIEASKDDGVSDEDLEYFKKISFDLGLDDSKAQKLLNSFIERKKANLEKQQAEQQVVEEVDKEKIHNALVAEYGEGYEKQLHAAHRALNAFADDDVIDLLDKKGLSNNIAMIKLFAKMGQLVSESEVPDAPADGLRTLADVEREIQSILNPGGKKETNPFFNSKLPEHSSVKQRYALLQKERLKYKK